VEVFLAVVAAAACIATDHHHRAWEDRRRQCTTIADRRHQQPLAMLVLLLLTIIIRVDLHLPVPTNKDRRHQARTVKDRRRHRISVTCRRHPCSSSSNNIMEQEVHRLLRTIYLHRRAVVQEDTNTME
jgi:hypothetical protein